MSIIYNICVLNHEDDIDDLCVSIEPRLPNFDGLKEAIFERFPVLNNKPLYMFYNDSFGGRVIIDTQSDFQIFHKKVLNKNWLNMVFLVRNPRQNVWSNIKDEILSSNLNIPSTSTRRTTRLRKQSDQFRMKESRDNFEHQSGGDIELVAGEYSDESNDEEMETGCEEESVIDTEDADESWDDISDESAFIELNEPSNETAFSAQTQAQTENDANIDTITQPNDEFGMHLNEQLYNLLSSASTKEVSVSNGCIETVNETAEAEPSINTNGGNAFEQTDEPKTDQSFDNNASKENVSVPTKANCDSSKTDYYANKDAVDAIRRFFAKKAASLAHTQT